jgi:hypothetical protein
LTNNPLTLANIPESESRENIGHVRVLHSANNVAAVVEYEGRQAEEREEEHDCGPVFDELEIDHYAWTILGEVRFPKLSHTAIVACLTSTDFMPLELQIPSYIGWKGIHHLLFLLALTIRG